MQGLPRLHLHERDHAIETPLGRFHKHTFEALLKIDFRRARDCKRQDRQDQQRIADVHDG